MLLSLKPIFTSCLNYFRILKQLFNRNSLQGICYEHLVNYTFKFIWILFRNWFIFTFNYSFVKLLHVFCLKWQLQWRHLICYAADWPDITFEIIGLVFPYFGTCIVRGAGLGIVKSVLSCQPRHVKVTNFNNVIICQKNVCWLQVSVHNFQGMQSFYSHNHLGKNFHNYIFLKHLIVITHVLNLLAQIPTVCVFHDQTKALWRFVNERWFIRDHIGMLDRCQVPNFS